MYHLHNIFKGRFFFLFYLRSVSCSTETISTRIKNHHEYHMNRQENRKSRRISSQETEKKKEKWLYLGRPLFFRIPGATFQQQKVKSFPTFLRNENSLKASATSPSSSGMPPPAPPPLPSEEESLSSSPPPPTAPPVASRTLRKSSEFFPLLGHWPGGIIPRRFFIRKDRTSRIVSE